MDPPTDLDTYELIPPDSAPYRKLPSINQWWFEFLVGAIFPLTYAEAWRNDFYGSVQGVRGAYQLIDMLLSGSSSGDEIAVNWCVTFEGYDGSEVQYNQSPEGEPPDDTRTYNVEVGVGFLGAAVVTVQGHSSVESGICGDEGSSPVGGTYRKIVATPIPLESISVWTIIGHDCTGSDIFETGTGGLSYTNVHWNDFQVSFDGDFTMAVTIAGLWECGTI